MAKDDDYKNRSVGLPITIFMVFLTICLMIPLGKVMIMWGLKSAYEGLGQSSISSSVRQKSPEELKLEEKVLERGNHRFTWTTDDIINLQRRLLLAKTELLWIKSLKSMARLQAFFILRAMGILN